MAHVDRKQYWIIFVVLGVLTAVEVGIAYLPKDMHTLMVIGLVTVALTKAAFVGFYYMHLGHETKAMRFTVVLPFTALAIYALVLIREGAWRLLA